MTQALVAQGEITLEGGCRIPWVWCDCCPRPRTTSVEQLIGFQCMDRGSTCPYVEVITTIDSILHVYCSYEEE